MVSARHYLCNLFIYHLKYIIISVVIFVHYMTMIFIITPSLATHPTTHHGFNKIFFSTREKVCQPVFVMFVFVFHIYHRHHHGCSMVRVCARNGMLTFSFHFRTDDKFPMTLFSCYSKNSVCFASIISIKTEDLCIKI